MDKDKFIRTTEGSYIKINAINGIVVFKECIGIHTGGEDYFNGTLEDLPLLLSEIEVVNDEKDDSGHKCLECGLLFPSLPEGGDCNGLCFKCSKNNPEEK